ncbi:MAG: ABC transporter ATP-binding protein [Coriobacteriales bacterium]
MEDRDYKLLEVRDLHSGYDKKEIVHGISFDVEEGEFVCIIGANGCGKTTTLKSILGLLQPFSGSVRVRGKETTGMKESERAKHFAYIPQLHTPPFPFTVADVVILGRTPYVNGIARVTDRDKAVAYKALEEMSLIDLADVPYTSLSGGQQQLVLIARALTQQPDILIMDEPTASLDFGNQQVVLSRMKQLTQTGVSVLMVTHDPDHALFCSTRTMVMEKGKIIADGSPLDVITTETLQRIYGSNVKVTDILDDDGNPIRVCVPLL